MRKKVSRIFALLMMTTLFIPGCSTDKITPSALDSSKSGISKEEKNGPGKVLIVYYSFSGNTRGIANIIRDMTGGDIVEIQPEEDYNRSDLEEIAKKQISEGYKPKLKNIVSNIDAYDLIFFGSPVWWYSVPPPAISFLSQNNWKGKKVVPFCTYGTVSGDFFKQFEKACPGAEVLKGIDFSSAQLRDMGKVKEKIQGWVKDAEKY